MNERLIKRFEELVGQLEAVERTKTSVLEPGATTPRNQIDHAAFLNWKVKAKNLLDRACGQASEHYRQFHDQENLPFYSSYDTLLHLKAVFLATKEDFEGGHLTSIRSLVRAEVFDTELEQASELLRAGYGSAAAVVAGVVLETTLRDMCSHRGIAVGTMDRMNADLAKAGVYNQLVQKRITALAAVRNSAAHGNPQTFTAADVEGMLADVLRFVTEHMT